MTNQEINQLGQQHAAAGKKLTPFECQAIDKQLFALAKVAASPAKFYAEMRGAFNKGWQAEYFRQVSA